MFRYPIAISLSPDTQVEDIWQAIKTLFQPWLWQEGKAIKQVENWFANYFGVNEAVSFNSGRSALYALLKFFEIGEGDEVMIQAFTCVAVPDPIIWAGATPVYVDVDDTLNIDYRLLEQKINPKTRAIIVQHTFGIPANLNMIKKITQKYNILLIEDCAHSLGARYKGKKVGSFGDAAFFSFGRDKVISSVFGGTAIINQKSKIKNQKLREIQKQLSYPSYLWIFQQLIHPVAFSIILPVYNLILGKILLYLLQKIQLLSRPVYPSELLGNKPDVFPARYPNALAKLLLLQLKKLTQYNTKRKKIADYYFMNLIKNKNIILPKNIRSAVYLRFNIFVKKPLELLGKAKKRKILMGNWYHNVIDPEGTKFGEIGYKLGSCIRAETLAKKSLNLPTYPRLQLDQLREVVELINHHVRD